MFHPLLLWLLAQVQLMQAHLWHSWRWILLMFPPETHKKDFNDWCDPGGFGTSSRKRSQLFYRMCLKQVAFNEVFHTHSSVPWYWRRCFFFEQGQTKPSHAIMALQVAHLKKRQQKSLQRSQRQGQDPTNDLSKLASTMWSAIVHPSHAKTQRSIWQPAQK